MRILRIILSIALVLLGLILFTGVIALLSTVWGSVITGVLMILCFYGAYKLFPKEKKENIKSTQTIQQPIQNKEVSDEIVFKIPEPKKVPYSIGSPEFKKASNTMLELYDGIQHYLTDPKLLNESSIESLEDLHSKSLLELHDLYQCENKTEVMELLTQNLSQESDVLQNLIYYSEDHDPIWIDDMDLIIKSIGENYQKLSKIIRG